MTKVIKNSIPNTVTCLNLFSGCIACVMAFEAKYELALLFIALSSIFDFFDGLLARMKVALITTIFGLIVALILQVFYNYVLSKIEALTSEMEDSSISLLDMVIKYNLKYKK